MKRNLKSYTNFLNELLVLERFYFATKYAYEETENVINFIRNNKLKFAKETDFGLTVGKPNPFSVKKRARTTRRNIILEIIYVRIVSALEVLLVDLIRDVFILTKEPFKRQDIKHQFSQGELLSLDSTTSILNMIINKECRKLSSGGYNDIVKYYKRHFNIEIGSFHPGNKRMEEIHDRRHLLVHKLGKTDKAYRKKYNTTSTSVFINEEYLLETISDLRSFSSLLKNQLDYRLNNDFNKPTKKQSLSKKMRVIELHHPENYEFEFLSKDYEFWAGDEYCKSNSIIKKIEKVDLETTKLEVVGEVQVLKSFLRLIRRRCKKNGFEFKEKGLSNDNNNGGFSQKLLDEELILKIKSELPEQPWEKGIHKLIATKLNVSNKISSSGIQQLIANGDFKMQIDGKIVE
ncbi:hypothetical protein HME9304_03210 [Flagellimonas maritima]|uniref:Uncharacterized protein n=1 Tax=Flagellimonas maritima TaxID=1383885 RepID=A0A2Z4LXT3_9FLAO|nr:hypothetical protein [Allomuricauda aurantiaca]AWX46178.1 hypothetical protein HME9304_03210 [Allomuricauda aurantiaca]